ncbi:ankyrin repeat-containing domain protein [Aspergillus alliaceus]|uniref:ankyrin repeat-containing domain protein n=1 Tax=Petromyces alliaceus TaxID=209559 RepID=UPI0012A75D50|nr:ankyrin repeat-containing domain protein [Aspergillus alliaceus]KAB8234489.1 ankyrin repeat-containing domain protein [Aspergillus alliaceus]
MKGQTRRRYTIAWICPLGVEYNAAVQMLDKQHREAPYIAGDSNAYQLCSIHGHNVVIVVLPEAGNVPAARAVERMSRSFPDLELALLVGIGGGVPVKTDSGDIRLGDVVVGTPASVHPGTVRYDQGKAEADQITRTGCLSRPPAALLGAVKKLEESRTRDQDPIGRNLRRFDTPDLKLSYSYPGTSEDRLFEADYNHRALGALCTECGCDTTRLVAREQRNDENGSPYVVVHHGTIGTGEMVIKDARRRDALAQQFGAICFETEAAGTLYNFSCLVVRGIADYCDSHKNREWHGYAAASAAAYARALLEHVPYQTARRSAHNEVAAERQRQQTATWLSPINYEHQQRHFHSMYMKGTGQWIFTNEKFKKWLNERKETLLFSGPPGTGKTVITSAVIQHLQRHFSGEPLTTIAYIYCEPIGQAEKSPLKLLSNILKQLYTGLDFIPQNITKLHQQCLQRQEPPKYGQLFRALTLVSSTYERVFIVIDALEEILGSDENCRQFIATLVDLQGNANVNILLTWSETHWVTHQFRSNVSELQIQVPVSDLEAYLDRDLDQMPFGSSDISVKQRIRTSALRALEKTPRFLLAYLWIQLFRSCSSAAEAIDTLETLPDSHSDYQEIYAKILERFGKQNDDRRKIGNCVFAWLSCALKPFTWSELQIAIAMQLKDSGITSPTSHDKKSVLSACLGLVAINTTTDVIQFVHATVYGHLEWPPEWPLEAHFGIASVCMTYLSSRRQSSIGTNKTVCTDSSPAGMLRKYAAQNWGHHVMMSRNFPTGNIIEFMREMDIVAESSCQIFALNGSQYHSQAHETAMTNMHLAAYFRLHDTLKAIIRTRETPTWYHGLWDTVWGGTPYLNPTDDCGRTPLSYAAEKGDYDIVKLLLEKGATIDLKDTNGRTPLSWAAGAGNVKIVSELLEHDASINTQDKSQRTPLFWAAANGHLPVVEKLLGQEGLIPEEPASSVIATVWKSLMKDRPDVNEDEPSGSTPLISATGNGHCHVVKYLLSTNASTETKDMSGRAALSWAAGNGHTDAVISLLMKGASIKAVDKEGRDALMWAAAHGHLATAESLMEGGASLTANDSARRAALSFAAENGQSGMVTMLLEKGAFVDEQDNHRRTALLWAAEGGHVSTLRILFDHGAILDHRNSSGRTALSLAAGEGHLRAAEALVNMGAKPELTDNSERNALSWAAGNGHIEVVFFLLDSVSPEWLETTDTSGLTFFAWAARNGQANVISPLLERLEQNLIRTANKHGQTAFFLACLYGHTEVVDIFLQQRVFNVCESDRCGNSPLLAAASGNHVEVVELLLRYGAPINTVGPYRRTVLWHAAADGRLGVVRKLLEHGANMRLEDISGTSPLLVAVEFNHQDVASLLLSHGADVNCPDSTGQFPLLWAVKHNDVTLARMLLARGAKVNGKDSEGLTLEARAYRHNEQGRELQALIREYSQRAWGWSSSSESIFSVDSR